jgi:hypothetical protein
VRKTQQLVPIAALFADGSVDQLPYDVQLADVARILLQQMGEDPAERWRIAGEPATKPGPIGQLSIARDGFGARGDRDPIVPSGRRHCRPV